MNRERLLGEIEAIIFACGEPVSVDRIAQVLEISLQSVAQFVELLKEKYNTTTGGINVLILGNNVQMCTNPAYIEPVRAVLDLRRNMPLSQAAMEVLAVIAYNQPVTKSFVEQVRGVDCSGVVGSLMEKGLLEERGRLELPGRPLLYGTTDVFLRCFNISSISELPPPPSAGEEMETTQDDETILNFDEAQIRF